MRRRNTKMNDYLSGQEVMKDNRTSRTRSRSRESATAQKKFVTGRLILTDENNDPKTMESKNVSGQIYLTDNDEEDDEYETEDTTTTTKYPPVEEKTFMPEFPEVPSKIPTK